MKFCTKCGNPLNGEEFCSNCGAAVETEAPVYGSADYEQPANKKSGIVKIIAGLVGVAAVALAVFFIFFGRSAKSVATQYMKAVIKGDAKKVVSLMPKAYVNGVKEEIFDGDKEKMIDALEDVLKYEVSFLEDNDLKPSDVKIKVTDVDKMDKDEVEDLNEDFEDSDIKLKVKAAKKVTVEMSYKDEDGEKQEAEEEIIVVKVGLSWYVIVE